MCGISGAVVNAQALQIALTISASLERRGYDNAGCAVQTDGEYQLVKTVGATTELRPLAANLTDGNVAIGHTRWATTGAVVQQNVHPFKIGPVVGAGNGDITNFSTLKAELRYANDLLTSEVDTEVGIAVIAEMYDDVEHPDPGMRLLEAVRRALPRLQGSFALVDGFDGFVVARHGVNTAYIGVLPDSQGFALSSDVESLLSFTLQYVSVENEDIVLVTQQQVRFVDGDELVERTVQTSAFDADSVSMGDFSSFLEKEIYEQPACLRQLVSVGIPVCPDFRRIRNAVILACGSARYASKVGEFLLKEAGFDARVVVASEFKSWPQIGDEQTMVIAVSQSGTTADVLEAVDAAHEQGFGPLVVITNTPSSPLATKADLVLPILSGPEISVASTKAVLSMVGVFALLVRCLNPEQPIRLREAAQLVETMLQNQTLQAQCNSVARHLAGTVNRPPMLVLGQGIGHIAAREAALKVKELTALPTESFPARELKHGPIAMITAGTPVLFCAVNLTEDTVVQQVKSRGAFTIGVVETGSVIAEAFDLVIEVPQAATPLEAFMANLVPLQLVALELALLLGKNVDRPANLAKSATTK
jgi:glucosamine--fructose-6-phosphate aminotransferase (isomerizing)